jgi:hypothetical protein
MRRTPGDKQGCAWQLTWIMEQPRRPAQMLPPGGDQRGDQRPGPVEAVHDYADGCLLDVLPEHCRRYVRPETMMSAVG